MSGVTSQSETYYASFIDKSDKLLEDHIHRLTRVVRPQQFYTWLRQRSVFTQDDQEEVESKYCTTTMRAGHLIDIMKTKGKRGFVAFMECVEFLHPELFKDLTKKDAREPFDDFNPFSQFRRNDRYVSRKNRQNANSIDVLAQAGELTSSLMLLLASKKEELKELGTIMTDMQKEQKEIEEDNSSLFEQLRTAREQLEEFVAQNEMLHDRIRKLNEERTHEQEQCTQLRSEKDDFASKCHDLMVELLVTRDKIREMEQNKSSTLKATLSVRARPSPPIPLKYRDSSSCRAKMLEADDSVTMSQENCWKHNAALKAEVSDLKKKELEWYDEKVKMEEELSNLDQRCCRLQENSDTFLQSYTHMKTERDQFSTACSDLNRKYEEERARNEKLTAECCKYQDQFRVMEEKICILKKEVDHRPVTDSVPAVTAKVPRSQKPKLPKKSYNTVSNGCMTITKSMAMPAINQSGFFEQFDWPDDSAALTKADGNSDVGTKEKPSTVTPKSTTDDKADDCAVCANEKPAPVTPKPVTLRNRFPAMCDRRQIEIVRQESYLNSYPVMIYAPGHLQKPLFDYLHPHFESCPYEVMENTGDMVSRSRERDGVIHRSTSQDGATCKLLTVDRLRNLCLQVRKTVLLPRLSPRVISNLCSHGIEPVVVFVKLEDELSVSELTAAEEALHERKLNKLEMLHVEMSISKDFTQLAEYVLENIKKLVLKHNFE